MRDRLCNLFLIYLKLYNVNNNDVQGNSHADIDNLRVVTLMEYWHPVPVPKLHYL